MSDEGKPDRITFSPDQRPLASDKGVPGASPAGKGFRFRRFSQSSRSGDGSGLFIRSRTATKDRDHEAGVYDEGFDAPRESDFRKKQIFHGWKLILLAYQSTGVIYGDIGTSPLYVFSSTFSSAPKKEDLLGALSIIIWSLTLIVTIKYVCIVLNADNEGQGGTFAMYSLLTRFGNISTGIDPNKENMIRFERHLTQDMRLANKQTRNFLEHHITARVLLSLMAIFGVSLIISDGILTPAQSVLGAIQGLDVIKPDLGNSAIVGITCGILVLLFGIQPLGIDRLSIVFAPVVIIWLVFNFSFGVYNLAKFDHTVLKAFSPYFAGEYFVRNKTEGWKSLGGILLCFTGVEALFADLGAFSKRAIQISWLGFAYPCLLMAYVGQAAHISVFPESYSNPFFNSVPPGCLWPALIVSTLAAIVASQALITSTFQLLFQVVNMSYFPPIKMVNTSTKYHSQIYIPVANWLMMIGTIVVTAVFKNTTKLGNAYGVCVILDTVITTTLVSLVALIVWQIKWYFVFPLWLTFATLEGLYMTSALNKVPDGAWFTLTLAIVIVTIFSTWRFGKERQWRSERKGRLPRLNRLVKTVEQAVVLTEEFGSGEVTPMKGFGIFFDKTGGDGVPVIYQEFINKFEAQPAVQVLLHLRATTVPYVSGDDKYVVTRTGLPNLYRIVVRYGYAEHAITSQLGGIVYDELRKYITTELLPDGRSTAVEPPMAAEGVFARPAAGTTGNEATDLPVKQGGETSSSNSNAVESSIAQENMKHVVGTPSPISNTERDRRVTALDTAFKQQVLYIFGKEELQIPPKGYNIFQKIFLSGFLLMRNSTNEKVTSLKIPMDKLVEVGFIREL